MRKAFILAISIFVLSCIWVLSGLIGGSNAEDKTTQNTTIESTNFSVRTINSVTSLLRQKINVTGQTEAFQHVELKAEVEGQISEILIEKGQKLTENDIIAEIDPKDRPLKRAEAQKRLEQRQIEYNAAKSLENKGYNSRIRLAETKADLEQAKAELKRAEIDVENLSLKSPINGILNTRPIEKGDYASIGETMATIVNLNPLKATAFLSEYQVVSVEKGSSIFVHFKDGTKKEGTLSYIAPSANEQTRTFQIEALIDNQDQEIRDGLTVELSIPSREVKAHRVPTSILTLDQNGVIGVKAVNDESIIEFFPAEVLDNRDGMVTLGNLPDQLNIVSVGQNFVSAGQAVSVQKETE